jgi:hypothetical protein
MRSRKTIGLTLNESCNERSAPGRSVWLHRSCDMNRAVKKKGGHDDRVFYAYIRIGRQPCPCYHC